MNDQLLTVLDALPSGLLERSAHRLHEVLPGPALIHLRGRRPDPLFVSVLLHGNENTGWEALRSILGGYAGKELPRAISILIGNVAAAREGLRFLPGQPDYNRIWNGRGNSAEHGMAKQVLEEMRQRRVFASIDIHNNTGLNPHYACINRLESPYLHLATLFSRTVVYFLNPDSVLSLAFASLCPSITVECGKPGQPHGVQHASELINACLHLSQVPEHAIAPHDVDLFHTVAVVKVPENTQVGFDETAKDIRLSPDIDKLNFREIPMGTTFGHIQHQAVPGLCAWNEAGEEVSARYFCIDDGAIRTTTPVMPSMLTLDPTIIRQDCLCYLMERMATPLMG